MKCAVDLSPRGGGATAQCVQQSRLTPVQLAPARLTTVLLTPARPTTVQFTMVRLTTVRLPQLV